MWKVPLFDLDYDEAEKQAVLEVLDSKWLSMGHKTQQFEQEFADYLGDNVSCTAVSSCTAALHMALLIANIQPDDEIIISGLTFVADANVVTMMGARIVLADITSTSNWNMSVIDTEKKITDKTKAIILVHYAGYPADIDGFVQLAKKHKLILIEDAAHAVGASYHGRQCGTFGDMACFSFFSNKNLATGEGGMLVTNNPVYNEQARLIRSHGMTSLTIDRHHGTAISYDVIQPGLNYRIDEIHSALGIVQLNKLDNNNNKRKRLVYRYLEEIKKSKINISIPFRHIEPKLSASYHIFPVLLPDKSNRNSVVNQLKEQGIQTSIHYPSFKCFSYYAYLSKHKTPVLDSISDKILTLPLYPDLTFDQIEYIVDTLNQSLI